MQLPSYRPLVGMKQSFLRTNYFNKKLLSVHNGRRTKQAGKRTKDRFPEKLWRIVNQCKTGAIGWSDDQPDVILIKYEDFKNHYLMCDAPAFKTQNVASFVRQLNLYGFHKITPPVSRKTIMSLGEETVHGFFNPNFKQSEEPIGMTRTYCASTDSQAPQLRRGAGRNIGVTASSFKRIKMGTPAVPDLMSSLYQRDIDTHSVRFPSPKSPVVSANRRRVKRAEAQDQQQENRGPLNQSRFKSKRHPDVGIVSETSHLTDQRVRLTSSFLGQEVRKCVSTDWYDDMMKQLDQFHDKSFDDMVKSLGGEDPVPWYPKSWFKSLSMSEVMDTQTAPSAFLSPLTLSGFRLLRDDSPLF